MKNSSFVKRVGHNVGIRFFAAALNLALHILLARSLSQEIYGQYVFFVTVLFLVSQLCNAGFDGAAIKFYQKFQIEDDLAGARGYFLTTLVIMLTVSLALSLLLSDLYCHLYNDQIEPNSFLLILLFLLANSLQKNIQSLLNSYKRFYVYTLPDQLFKPIFLIVSFLICSELLAEQIDVHYLIYLQLFSLLLSTGFGLLFTYGLLQRADICDVRFDLRNWVKTSLPFLGNISIRLIYRRFDIVMLGLLAGNSYVAIYAVANRAYALLSYIFIAFNGVASPLFAESYHEQKFKILRDNFDRYSSLLRMFVFSFGGLMILASNYIMILFGSSYAEGAYVLVIFIVTLIITSFYGLPTSLLTMTGHQGFLFNINLLGLVVNVGLNLVLIPAFNVYGAALATFVSMNISIFLAHRKTQAFFKSLC